MSEVRGRNGSWSAALGLTAALLCLAGPASAQPAALTPLPAYQKLDPSTVTVSGLSSGGFFAHQFHVAYSGLVHGAAIVAAGPYACAAQIPPALALNPLAPVIVATAVCAHKERNVWTDWLPEAPDPDWSVEIARREHADGTIDDPANIADDRIWLFFGDKDRVVPPATVRALRRFYERLGARPPGFVVKEEPRANHGMPVEGTAADRKAVSCGQLGPPFLIDCGYDAAGALLRHLYPENWTDRPGAPDRSRLVRFDQTQILGRRDDRISMGRAGYVYVPADCENGAAFSGTCRLHVAFHGCLQDEARVQDAFYWHAGYNRWAEANHIVVLYPQAAASPPFNPEGCWDWWGYTGADFYRRNGGQMQAVRAMIGRMLQR